MPVIMNILSFPSILFLHLTSPLYIYALHCLEENHFFSSLLQLLQLNPVSMGDFSNLLDLFFGFLPFFFKERYESLIREFSPVFLSLFSNLLKVGSGFIL